MNLGIDALKRLIGSVSKFILHGEVSNGTLSAVNHKDLVNSGSQKDRQRSAQSHQAINNPPVNTLQVAQIYGEARLLGTLAWLYFA